MDRVRAGPLAFAAREPIDEHLHFGLRKSQIEHLARVLHDGVDEARGTFGPLPHRGRTSRLRFVREKAAVDVDGDSTATELPAFRHDLLVGELPHPLTDALLLAPAERGQWLVFGDAVERNYVVVAAGGQRAKRWQYAQQRRTKKPLAPLSHREPGDYGTTTPDATATARADRSQRS